MDLTTLIGLVVGIGAVLGGQVLEGGTIGTLTQGTAAAIVFGGTFGAVLAGTPGKTMLAALKALGKAFMPQKFSADKIVSQLTAMAGKARKDGLLALESDVAALPDAFMKKAFTLAIDGVSLENLAETMQAEIEHVEERDTAAAKVFETAGGFSPTIGIIGAVLGLIHVMENLSDASKLGAGIAVAFVATVYGVGLANLVLFPLANKLKTRVKEEVARMNLMLQGVALIYSGENQHYIEQRLSVYLAEQKAGDKGKGKAAK